MLATSRQRSMPSSKEKFLLLVLHSRNHHIRRPGFLPRVRSRMESSTPPLDHRSKCKCPSSTAPFGPNLTKLHHSSISQHHYSGSFCAGSEGILQDLMTKSTIRGNLSSFSPDIAAVKNVGLEYVLGETNSYSCHGAPGVSNTAGAALWGLDYALFSTQLGISRVYFHEGIGYKYNFVRILDNHLDCRMLTCASSRRSNLSPLRVRFSTEAPLRSLYHHISNLSTTPQSSPQRPSVHPERRRWQSSPSTTPTCPATHSSKAARSNGRC